MLDRHQTCQICKFTIFLHCLLSKRWEEMNKTLPEIDKKLGPKKGEKSKKSFHKISQNML